MESNISKKTIKDEGDQSIIKPSKVKFISEELEENYNSMDNNDLVKISINRAIQEIRQNAFAGIPVPKRLIPKEYLAKYDLKNLWKYDLPKGWRLMYTITSEDEVQLISALLEWFNHKKYERRFNYLFPF